MTANTSGGYSSQPSVVRHSKQQGRGGDQPLPDLASSHNYFFSDAGRANTTVKCIKAANTTRK